MRTMQTFVLTQEKSLRTSSEAERSRKKEINWKVRDLLNSNNEKHTSDLELLLASFDIFKDMYKSNILEE